MTDKSILPPRGCRSDERKEESGKTAAEPRENNKGRAHAAAKNISVNKETKRDKIRDLAHYTGRTTKSFRKYLTRGFHFERNATMYTFDDDPNYLGRKTCCIRSGISGPTVLHTVESNTIYTIRLGFSCWCLTQYADEQTHPPFVACSSRRTRIRELHIPCDNLRDSRHFDLHFGVS
ncbi:unnamed protein product [Lasius platythorax]|uniref:Uncharacterized protein n=1 Tax=Lasius platythorax TaxID=488582 RepID=A0AAV2NP16_9HYME